MFLIDLLLDPVGNEPIAAGVPGLVQRVRRLKPEKIIVIKAGVYDVVHDALVEAGLPVVPVRVPFPGSGQQRRFVEAFKKALETAPH